MTYRFEDYKAGKLPPKGWDVADACDDGWSRQEVETYIKETLVPWSPEEDPPPQQPTMQQPKGELRPVEQVKPKSATVTDISTRRTYTADAAWAMNMVMDDKGVIKTASVNASLLLENYPDMLGVIQFDAFRHSIFLVECPPWEDAETFKSRPIRDTDYTAAIHYLESRPHEMKPSPSQMPAIFANIAGRHRFDPLLDYLDGLKWDGTPRVDGFFHAYLGAQDNAYSKAISRRFLISAVARAYRPGCKVDTMPIIEGDQGLMKSTAIKELFGPSFFSDELSDIGSKDAKMEMQGVWCIEIAEMHRLNSAETNQVKKFLSQATDRFRPPYGRSVVEAPRRLVLAGTMNPEGNAYLKDPTGARRFWPIEATAINLDAIRQDRDQIWAEAVHMLNAGEPWWIQDHEKVIVETEQLKRTEVDVWADVIADELGGVKSISLRHVLNIVGVDTRDADHRHTSRIGRVMKMLGWTMVRETTNRGVRILFKKDTHEW